MPPKQSPFTPEQEQEALGLFKQGLNASDVMRHFGATAMQKKPSWQSEQESLTKQRNKTAVLSDIPNDVGTGLRQLGEGYQERYGRLKESGGALARGEQSIAETGVQFGANIAGGLLADTTYQLARTGASFGMSQQQEDQFAESFGGAVAGVDESVGISNWYGGLSPRAQRNVNAALDILDVAPVPVLDKVKGLFGGKPKPNVDSQAALQDAYNRAARGETSSDAARVVNNSVDDAAREKLVTDLSAAYNDSLVGDLKTYNRKLQEQAQGMSRGGEIVTQDDLVRALANEGIVPDIRGKLADFTAEIRRIEERQNKLFEQYQPILDASPATANVNDFRDFAKQSLVGRRSMAAELDQAEARLDTAIDNIARSLGVDETGMLTAKQIDEMSRIANDRTGAYRDTDVFQADVFSELGRASRLWLEENVPDNAFREVNDEWMRLNNIKETAGNLQNAQIDVGLLGRAIGSYVTTIGATALAAPSGNPAIALIAGMLTKMGGDEVANWMRSRKFSPEVRDVLQKNVLERDSALLERLKQSATNQDNKNFYDALSRQLPSARPDAPRSEVSSGAPIATGGQTPTGRVEAGITERTREGAVRQPEGERTPTELEGVLRDDIDAVEQAVSEMEAEMSGSTRPSVGENFVQTNDGGAYRFNELPSWIPKEFRDAELMQRVMNNIVNGKKPRSNAGNEIELQRLVEDRIKSRVKEIKKGKGDTGVFTGDTAFAAALMVGGTYFLAGEDGELLPIVAIGSMMANPLARKSAIQNAKMMAKNGKKLPEPYKRKIAEELEAYDTGSVDVISGGQKTTIAPGEVDMRLEELQAKNYNGTFTNADALEAEELMASKGILIDPPESFNQGATPQTTLLEEAKSADEYLQSDLGGKLEITGDRYVDGEFMNGKTTFVTPKGRVELSIKEKPEEIKLFQIIAEEKGTGVGGDIVNSLKKYSEQSGKKLTIVKPNDYWKRFDWLTPTRGKDKFGNPLEKVDPNKPLRDQVYSLEYNPSANKPSLLEEAKGKTLDEFVKGHGVSLYHGSDIEIKEFNKSFGGETTGNNKLGTIFLTADKNLAKQYGIQASLAKNPNVSLNTPEGMRLEALAEKQAKVNQASVSLQNPKIIDLKGNSLDVNKSLGEQLKAIDEGFDGIIYKNATDDVRFNPDKKPTDIYAVFDPTKIKTKSQLEDIWNQANKPSLLEEAKTGAIELSKKQEGTLVAIHNLTQENVRFADEIGGLPNPSVGIIKPTLNDFESFGDISLLADKDFLFSGKGKTFGADVYSPRFPQIETYTKNYDQFKNTMSKYIGDKFVDEGDFYRVAKNDPAFEKAFEKNLKLPPRERIEEFDIFIESIAEEAGIKKRIFDGFTPSGKRKYLKVDAESISKSMSKAQERGGETMFYGLPSIRSMVAPQFRSTQAIKKAENKIVSKESFGSIKEQYEKQFSDLMADVTQYYKYDKNSFGSYDDIGRGLGEYYSGNTKVLDDLFEDMPLEVKNKIDLFGMELSQMPTEYFETKFKRVVGLDEFSHAVIPDDTPKSVKDILKRKGVKYTEYKRGDGNQTEAIRKALLEKGLMFGLGAFVYVESQE